jgi:hypothetical protein
MSLVYVALVEDKIIYLDSVQDAINSLIAVLIVWIFALVPFALLRLIPGTTPLQLQIARVLKGVRWVLIAFASLLSISFAVSSNHTW